MEYVVETKYMEHDGGTKFYETVIIREDSGPAILIKRYGPIANKHGGGTTIIERGDWRTVAASAQKIQREKLASKKGYQVKADPTFGMHPLHNRTTTGKQLSEALRRSYGGRDWEAIESYFNLNANSSAWAGEIVDTESEPEAPAAASTAEWGSW